VNDQRPAQPVHQGRDQRREQRDERAQPRMDRQDDREQMRWLVPPRRWFGLG
jgi:hypothetical protein